MKNRNKGDAPTQDERLLDIMIHDEPEAVVGQAHTKLRKILDHTALMSLLREVAQVQKSKSSPASRAIAEQFYPADYQLQLREREDTLLTAISALFMDDDAPYCRTCKGWGSTIVGPPTSEDAVQPCKVCHESGLDVSKLAMATTHTIMRRDVKVTIARDFLARRKMAKKKGSTT